MNKKYRKMIEQIKLDSEAYTDKEMEPVYKAQKKELDALNVLVGALFIKYSIDGLLKMNSSQKANIGVKTLLKDMGKRLGNVETEKVTSILSNVFTDTYYKNAFVQDIGLKIDLKFNILKKEFIDSAVNAKYKGEFFSDRIWNNKGDLIDGLQKSLIKAMNGEVTIDRVAKEIKDKFNVSAYQSSRLANTECARVQEQASYDIGKSIGIEQVLFSSTLDDKTSEFCSEEDGKIYGIDDSDKPELPAHPNCRSTYISVPYENWSPTNRKDNISKEIIDYKDYNQWATDKGI